MFMAECLLTGMAATGLETFRFLGFFVFCGMLTPYQEGDYMPCRCPLVNKHRPDVLLLFYQVTLQRLLGTRQAILFESRI